MLLNGGCAPLVVFAQLVRPSAGSGAFGACASVLVLCCGRRKAPVNRPDICTSHPFVTHQPAGPPQFKILAEQSEDEEEGEGEAGGEEEEGGEEGAAVAEAPTTTTSIIESCLVGLAAVGGVQYELLHTCMCELA